MVVFPFKVKGGETMEELMGGSQCIAIDIS